MPSMQPTEQICTSPPGSTGSEHVPLYPSCVRLPESSVSRANATGVLKVLKKLVEVALVGSKIRLASWLGCVIYFTDQLMTPYFSGGSTLNGTPGGDRWARVLCGQIGWLSEPLHRVDAECSGCTNLKMWLPERHEKIPPHWKHTTKPTSAQRTRPPREDARKTTSHALAYTRPLP